MRTLAPKRLPALFALALAALLWVLHLNGWAQPQLPQAAATAWWLDASGQSSLDDAMRADYTPYRGWLGLGYGPAPVWVKLTLPATPTAGHTPATQVVRVRPSFLDHVTLYDPALRWQAESGDALPPREDELDSIYFCFEIPALPQARDIYVRVETTSTRTIDIDVRPPSLARSTDHRQEMVIGLLVSINLIFSLGAVFLWFKNRHQVLGWFAITQTVTFVYVTFNSGFARILIGPYLPAGWLTAITSSLVMLAVSVSVRFFYVFFKRYQPPTYLMKAFSLVIVLPLLLFLYAWVYDVWWLALKINTIAVLLAITLPILLALSASKTMEDGEPIYPSRLFLLVLYTLYFCLVAPTSMAFLGWIAMQDVFLYFVSLHTLTNGIVMSFVLRQQSQRIALRHEATVRQIKLEIEQREAREKLFTMLAHELKTPLASLRMWLDVGSNRREIVEDSIHDMNQIIERCVQTEQLSDQKLTPLLEDVDFGALSQRAIATCRAPERIAFTPPAAPAWVRADVQILAIVLSNLLDNACKYSAPSSPIAMQLHALAMQGQAGWQWTIANAAGDAGVPPADKVFEKYWRSPHAQRQSGSGLGLFLVQGLVALLHGTIACVPQDGRVVFCVWLPEK